MVGSWSNQLFEYDFAVIHRPGIQNAHLGRLSRLFPPLGAEERMPTTSPLTTRQLPKSQLRAMAHTATPNDESHPACMEPPGQRVGTPPLHHHLRGHFGIKAVIASIHEEGPDWPNLAAEVKEVCITDGPSRSRIQPLWIA